MIARTEVLSDVIYTRCRGYRLETYRSDLLKTEFLDGTLDWRHVEIPGSVPALMASHGSRQFSGRSEVVPMRTVQQFVEKIRLVL